MSDASEYGHEYPPVKRCDEVCYAVAAEEDAHRASLRERIATLTAERDRALATRAADPEGLIRERAELLVEVEKLRAERDQAIAEHDELAHDAEDWLRSRKAALAVVERAKAWRAGHAPPDRHKEAAWAYADTENALIAAVDTYNETAETLGVGTEGTTDVGTWRPCCQAAVDSDGIKHDHAPAGGTDG